MNETRFLRELERQLVDDPRTHELTVRLRINGDRIVAEGDVATAQRRQAILEVLAENDAGLPVTDQLTLSAEPVSDAGASEQVAPPPQAS
ncbi:MAG: hypothetical protein ACM3UO_00495 [Bacillota bacterium]